MRTRLYLGIDFHIMAILFRESSKLIEGVTVKVKTRHVLNPRNRSSILSSAGAMGHDLGSC